MENYQVHYGFAFGWEENDGCESDGCSEVQNVSFGGGENLEEQVMACSFIVEGESSPIKG